MPKEPHDESSDRPFCRTTGFLFQSFGFLLSISTCCWWPVTSCWQQPIRSTEAGRTIPNLWADAAPEMIWAMIAVALSFIAGLGMIVVGLGLQQDRRSAAGMAFVLTATVGAFFWCYLGVAIIHFPATGRILMAVGLALVWTIGFLLAGICRQEVKKHPPPMRCESAWTSSDEDDLRKTSSPDSQDRTSR